MDGVQRVWHRRLRWRLRGAWMWPAFLVLTVADGVLLVALPPYEGGPPHVFPGVLLALFLNLLTVAVVAPLAGLALRRRRPDLPRLISSAPQYQSGLDHIDAIRTEEDRYRVCVPGRDERHSLCLFVRTDQQPPGITRDTDQEPNGAFHQPPG
jgi:hypothetical protein